MAATGAVYSEAVDIIDNAQSVASAYGSDAQQQADQAINLATVYGGGITVPPVVVDNVAGITTAITDPTGKVEAAFASTYAMFTDDYQAQINTFIQTYFPAISGTLTTASDAWLENAIVNGGSGLPADVENALWQRDRDRVSLAASEAERTAVSEYAGRGFSMPSGVLDNKVADIRLQASRQLAESSRTAAITHAEWALKNTQFAMEQTIKLRIGAMDALAAFLHAYAGIYSAAVDYSKVILACQTDLWAASIQYYSAQISYTGVKAHGKEVDATVAASTGVGWLNTQAEMAKGKASAAIGAASALASMASAALAAQHTNVGMGYNESI
jgi:hypothetical protein